MKETAAQKGVGQFLFVVRGDDDHGALFRPHRLTGLVDMELHPVEFLQQVIRKLDIRLVDLVDQQHDTLVGRKGFPQLAALDVSADIVNLFVPQLAVAQPAHGVVFVETLLRAGGGFHVPFDDRHPQGRGHLAGQFRLAGARLALDQQGPLQPDRRVHGHGQVLRRDVGLRSLELHVSGVSFDQSLAQDPSPRSLRLQGERSCSDNPLAMRYVPGHEEPDSRVRVWWPAVRGRE